MQKNKKKQLKLTDKKTGVKASIDKNGFLHLDNIPLARSGIVQQPISVVGYASSALSEEDWSRGWFYAYRAPEAIFAAKALSSWSGVPLMRNSSGGHYTLATANKPYLGIDSEPQGNRPLGTVQSVCRGKGKKSDVLYGHIVIWNVHDFARELVSNKAWAIAPTFYLKNKKSKRKDASVEQTVINANSAFLCHGDVYEFDVMSPEKGLHKWLQENVVDAILPAPKGMMRGKSCTKYELSATIKIKGDSLKRLGSFVSLKSAKEDKFLMRSDHNLGDYFVVYGDGKKKTDEKYYWNGREFVSGSKIGLPPSFLQPEKAPPEKTKKSCYRK